jgi:hypothetical protein
LTSVRTCVRITARPYNPIIELDGALDRGNLSHAITLAAEVAEDSDRPISLDGALRFLPLVAAQRPASYDAWALRWLRRWIDETSSATIGQAAEIVCALADGATEPLALESVRRGVK